MRTLFRLIAYIVCVAQIAWAQTASISDTLTASIGGSAWTGRIVVSLNSPANAQPLYAGTTSLAGWQYTLCVGVTGSDCSATSAAGAVALTIYANTSITPSGTSYTARYLPTRGSGWSETWVVDAADTKLYQIRSTTVPTPTVTFSLNQIAQGGASSGQCLAWSGTAWAPASCGSGGGGGNTWDSLTSTTWDSLQ